MSKAVILGAGSIGCYAGMSWLTGGLDVSFIGRSPVAEALSQSGGTICAREFSISIAADKIHFSNTPEALQEADIIALTVKTITDSQAAADIRRYARPDAIILSLQNGVDNALHLSKLLPGFEIVEGMVPYNVIRPKPARFKKASAGTIMAGHNAKLEAFYAPLQGSPFAIEFRSDMRAVKWSKLLLNLNNPLNAMSGETIYDELSQRPWRALLAGLQRECLAVMEAEKITPARLGPLPPRFMPAFLETPDWFFNRTGLKLQKLDRNSRGSMADDFAHGRMTEIDFINGAVLAYAARHAIPCPCNETVVRLVKEAEDGGRKLWSAQEIGQEISLRSANAAS
jgi:2-dehydropantoate 2-reductase